MKKSDYTLIVPTYNRPDYLERVLSYFQKKGVESRIIIADSSLPRYKKRNEEVIKKIGIHVDYLGDFDYKIHPHRKLAFTINKVKTKYCVMCADDDFIVPKTIEKSIRFLDKNPDYTCCHGRYVLFDINEDRCSWNDLYPSESIISSDPKIRLKTHIKYYCPTYYAVFRTEFINRIFKESTHYINQGLLGEILPSMLTVVYGKIKRLPLLYCARDLNAAPKTAGKKFYYDIVDLKEKGFFKKIYSSFHTCLAKHLSKQGINDAEKIADDVFEQYYKVNFSHNIPYKIKRILDRLPLPELIYNLIRGIYRKLFSKGAKHDYGSDMEDIRIHVTKHPCK
ncbi:MAG: TIGR00180 family glycosyltransferase [Nanoarchaeota archaeon]|nr:TIGR00180 family glycosyltransferase [Nanoarchaeota archaeon]